MAISKEEFLDAVGAMSVMELNDLVKAFESYVVSEEGQQAAADSAKSAPLSSELAEKAAAAIETIKVKS